jgi:aminocarboxymuconate-semialdehyde decarboxylase
MFEIEATLERAREAEIGCHAVSNPMIGGPGMTMDFASLDAVRRYNDFLAGVCQRFPGRIIPLAATVPWGGDAYRREEERALDSLGLAGFGVTTSYKGCWLDDDAASPFLACAAERRVPVFIHPPTSPLDVTVPKAVAEAVMRPFDTTVTLARLLFSNAFKRYPGLVLIAAHVGGALPALVGRLACSHEVGADSSFGAWGYERQADSPLADLSRVYVDTVSWHAPYVDCAVKTLGADHVLFGTDFPPVTLPLERALAAVRDAGLTPVAEAQVLGENAARLFGLAR